MNEIEIVHQHALAMALGRPRRPIRRVRFQPAEDQILTDLVAHLGTDAWESVARRLPGRNARQCRDRWNHYLAGRQAAQGWTIADDIRLCRAVSSYGSQWRHIGRFFGGRSPSDLENRWIALSALAADDDGENSAGAAAALENAPHDGRQPAVGLDGEFQFDDRFWLGVELRNAMARLAETRL
jgi:hypothetical protein